MELLGPRQNAQCPIRCQLLWDDSHHSYVVTGKGRYRARGQSLFDLAFRKIESAILPHTPIGVRTISTEHFAWRATNSATLPSKKRCMPLCPCEPTTIRSALHSAAESMMLSLMSPTSMAVLALNPAARSSFAIRSTNSWAGFFCSSNSGAYPGAICGGAGAIGCNTCKTWTSVFSVRNCVRIALKTSAEDFESSIPIKIFMTPPRKKQQDIHGNTNETPLEQEVEVE